MISKIIFKMIKYFRDDVKRISHALKVFGYVKAITADENLSDEQTLIVELASVLHDIGIKEAEIKYASSSGKYQEMEGPIIARHMMNEIVKPDLIDRVCYIIGNHHSYDKIDGQDFQVLIEADFLVNINEGNLPDDTIKSIKTKYFKTKTGLTILENIYNV